MKILATLSLLATLLATVAAPLHAAAAEADVPAADADVEATVEATAETPATVNDDSAAADEDATPGTLAADDTFVPTVEISEDLSVSFPADI